MAISEDKSFIFIKINKAAGSSIQQQLASVVPDLTRDGHKVLTDYPVDFDRYFKFAFVRNPWDKMVSFYSYHARRGFDLLPRERKSLLSRLVRPGRKGARPQPSFREFILVDMHRMQYAKPKGESSRGMRTSNQIDWLTDSDGKIAMDFIGRFESIQDDFDHVCKELKIPAMPLRHVKRSKRRDYASYYDDDTYNAVATAFSKDIAYLDYRF